MARYDVSKVETFADGSEGTIKLILQALSKDWPAACINNELETSRLEIGRLFYWVK